MQHDDPPAQPRGRSTGYAPECAAESAARRAREHDGAPARPPRLAIVASVAGAHDAEVRLAGALDALVGALDALVARGAVAGDSYLLCVDDGSRAGTWPLVAARARRDARVRGLKLARRRGARAATLAGLLEADADAYLTLGPALVPGPPGAPGTAVARTTRALAALLDGHAAGRDVVAAPTSVAPPGAAKGRLPGWLEALVSRVRGAGVADAPGPRGSPLAAPRLLSRRAVDALRSVRHPERWLRQHGADAPPAARARHADGRPAASH